MIIDFHTHIFSPKIRENRADYIKLDPCFNTLYANPKAKLATAEDLLASMDRSGVDISVVLNIGWVSHELCVETNSYIMEVVSRYPDRLIGFCSIQPRAGEAAVAEVERCVRGRIKGIGELRSDVQGFDLDDEATMRPIAQVAMQYGLIILTHASEPVGHAYPGKGAITPDILYRFIANFPDLPIVCSHWGGGLPFYALMPEVARVLSNVSFDTAASPFLYQPEIFKRVADIFGMERILFGTDYPLITQSRLISSIRALALSEEAKTQILGQNAQRLLQGQGC